MDYYQILGVSHNANQNEIKKAYRQMAQKYHPDREGGNAEKFKQVNEAYQTLSDEQKRSQYDQYGATYEQMRSQGQTGGFRDFRDFATFKEEFADLSGFGDWFSDLFGGSRASSFSQHRGQDLNLEIAIDLEETISGSEREIDLDKNVLCVVCQGSGADASVGFKTCSRCQGSGQYQNQSQSFFGFFSVRTVCSACQGAGKIPEKQCAVCHGQGRLRKNIKLKFKIPAGIRHTQVINLAGQGEPGIKGGRPGDLNLKIFIRPHRYFVRRDDDLYYNAQVRFTQLALGDKIKVPTPQGERWVKIPKGGQTDSQIRLRGQGVPHLYSRGRGDEIIKLNLEVPKRLSRKQKQLLENLKRHDI